MSFGEQLKQKRRVSVVLTETEDSSEGLVKVAMLQKVFKNAQKCVKRAGKGTGKTCYSPKCAFLMSTKDFAHF